MSNDHNITKAHIKMALGTNKQNIYSSKDNKPHGASSVFCKNNYYPSYIEKFWKQDKENKFMEYCRNKLTPQNFVNDCPEEILDYIAMTAACATFRADLFSRGLQKTSEIKRFFNILRYPNYISDNEKLRNASFLSNDRPYRIIKLKEPLPILGDNLIIFDLDGRGYASILFPITVDYVFCSGWWYDRDVPSNHEICVKMAENSSEIISLDKKRNIQIQKIY
jgi:hypothetical protein